MTLPRAALAAAIPITVLYGGFVAVHLPMTAYLLTALAVWTGVMAVTGGVVYYLRNY